MENDNLNSSKKENLKGFDNLSRRHFLEKMGNIGLGSFGLSFQFSRSSVEKLNFTYDGKSVANYAWDHYLDVAGHDPYPYFDDDCTNFVSQCILAGGLQMEIPNGGIGLPIINNQANG